MSLVLVAFVLTARALAIVAGVLVLLDSFKVITGVESPVHSPRGNAAAWAIVALSAIVGAGTFLYFGALTVGRMDAWGAKMGVAGVWTGLAIGLVYRACIRSCRPTLIVGSASLFSVAAFVMVLLQGA